MPRLDGLEATGRPVTAHPAARVLVLTTFDNDELVYDALRSGASGFLKSAPRDQLVGSVRIVAGGEQLLAPAITRRLIEDFVRRPPPGKSRPSELEELSERELEVLTLIARGRSNDEI